MSENSIQAAQGPRKPSAAAPQELGFQTLKAAYLQHIRLRNFSELTVRQVELALRKFIEYSEATGVDSVHHVNRDTLEQYKVHLAAYRTRQGLPFSQNTVRDRVGNVQRWFRFLRKKGVIKADPIADVVVGRVARHLPRGVFTPEEIRRIMAQPDLKTPVGYRDRAMMEVLYSTGVRAAELSNLALQDVDLIKKVARVRNGKGGKDRFVLFSTPCIRFLGRYLSEVRPRLAQGMRFSGHNWLKKHKTGGDRLFLSVYGGPVPPAWLSQIMKRYILKAGITKPVSPAHSFRHYAVPRTMPSCLGLSVGKPAILAC